MVIGMHCPAFALTIEADRQLNYAEMLFANQQYLRAAEEYQRFSFFFPDHPKKREAIFKSGESFLLAGDPAKALAVFKDLSASEPMDSLAAESFFKMADAHLMMNAPTHALVQLNNIITLSADPKIKDRAYYRIAWIHIELTDWDGAKTAFDRITPAGRSRYKLTGLDTALGDAKSIGTKSPALAGTLSIIPGGGQLYCHRYEDAFIALAVNVGLIWAACDAFDNDQYGLGGLISFVGIGFYAGNIYGAVNDAHKYNRMQKRQFIDQLKNNHQVSEAGPPRTTAGKALAFSLNIPF
ncbi:MAG: tetratricopeptide repeat protein [Desulfobacteraceae bacterium]|jgi:tetratricopeptide (TPR) repeat protein